MRKTVIVLAVLLLPGMAFAQTYQLSDSQSPWHSFGAVDYATPSPHPQGITDNTLRQQTATVSNEGHIGDASGHHASCDSCDSCNSCSGHGGLGCRLGHGHCRHHERYLCAPRNMVQHLPYQAEPKTYYYFRPYNFMHVPMQQQQAMQMGLDPINPYDNTAFQRVFAELDANARAPVSSRR